jgi:hypothetical protein
MSTPIIFLDIDGVLNNPGCYLIASGSRTPPDPKCVEALNYITESSGARIVVSSSWRIGREVIELRELLIGWGVKAPVISKTPYLGTMRGLEIADWLLRHEGTRYYPSSFIVLDDDPDAEPFLDHLIQTAGHIGLTMADAERAIRHIQSANAVNPQTVIDTSEERRQKELRGKQ